MSITAKPIKSRLFALEKKVASLEKSMRLCGESKLTLKNTEQVTALQDDLIQTKIALRNKSLALSIILGG